MFTRAKVKLKIGGKYVAHSLCARDCLTFGLENNNLRAKLTPGSRYSVLIFKNIAFSVVDCFQFLQYEWYNFVKYSI